MDEIINIASVYADRSWLIILSLETLQAQPADMK